MGGWMGGWVDGWVDGRESGVKDCLQQSINTPQFYTRIIFLVIFCQYCTNIDIIFGHYNPTDIL